MLLLKCSRLSTAFIPILSKSKHTTFKITRLYNNTIKNNNNKCTTTLLEIPLRLYTLNFNYSTQKKAEFVTLNFKLPNGKFKSIKAKVGKNLLDVVLDNNLDIDGYGACEGTLACSTCHVVFSQQHYDMLPSSPCDEELDMLDLAYSLTDTSRLGCQVIVKKEMEGWEIVVPTSVDAR